MGIKSFNNPTSKYNAVWGQTGLGAVNPSPVPPDYVKASGGTETTYAPSPTVKYQVHSFLTSSTFVVDTAPGANPTVPTTIDILVVGGGGGSGSRNYGGAGGGGGGMAVAT